MIILRLFFLTLFFAPLHCAIIACSNPKSLHSTITTDLPCLGLPSARMQVVPRFSPHYQPKGWHQTAVFFLLQGEWCGVYPVLRS